MPGFLDGFLDGFFGWVLWLYALDGLDARLDSGLDAGFLDGLFGWAL